MESQSQPTDTDCAQRGAAEASPQASSDKSPSAGNSDGEICPIVSRHPLFDRESVEEFKAPPPTKLRAHRRCANGLEPYRRSLGQLVLPPT